MDKEIAVTNKKQDPLRALIEKMKPEVQSALPRMGVTTDRLCRVFMTCVRKNPKLARCSQQSLAAALMQCSELGLEPGSALGHVWLIPYKTECTTIIGYKGLVELMRRSGEIKSLSVNIVYEQDLFEYELGLNQDLKHVPSKKPVSERGEITHAYFVAHFINGGHHVEVMDRSEINAIRDNSQGKDQDPWKKHYGEMARKTVLRRASKLMPTAIVPPAVHEQFEREDAIDAEFVEAEEVPENNLEEGSGSVSGK